MGKKTKLKYQAKYIQANDALARHIFLFIARATLPVDKLLGSLTWMSGRAGVRERPPITGGGG